MLYGLALAGDQDSIISLLRTGASIPYDVIDICRHMPPLADSVIDALRTDIVQGDEQRRRAALLASMISNRPDVSDLLAGVLEGYPADSPEARLAVLARSMSTGRIWRPD